MSRLHILQSDEMTPEQHRVAEDIRTGRRAEIHGDFVPTGGPMNAWLRIPSFGTLAEKMGVHCRFEMRLDRRLSELAIILVAKHFEAPYEFDIHAAIAEQAGLSRAIIDAIYRGETPVIEAADERIMFRFASKLLSDKRVDDRLYGEAVDTFGEAGVVEIVSLLGYYSLVSLTLNAFQVHS